MSSELVTDDLVLTYENGYYCRVCIDGVGCEDCDIFSEEYRFSSYVADVFS